MSAGFISQMISTLRTNRQLLERRKEIYDSKGQPAVKGKNLDLPRGTEKGIHTFRKRIKNEAKTQTRQGILSLAVTLLLIPSLIYLIYWWFDLQF